MAARDNMALYMRERRKRLKAQGLNGNGRPYKDRAGRERLEAEKAVIRARGGDPVEMQIGGGPTQIIDLDAPPSRPAEIAPEPRQPTAVYSLPAAELLPKRIPPIAAPRPSMLASGGVPPGPPVRAVMAEATAAWRAKTEMMLSALAARVDRQEREIAQLKADARVRNVSLGQAFVLALASFGRG
jgi:hypothetical protein